ncbi:MAG: paraquat-inducible protein A [Planctomycetota bacterium]
MSDSTGAELPLRGCPHCGLVQHLPSVSTGEVGCCVRCRQVVARPKGEGTSLLTAAISLAALILFPLGITLPVLRLEQLGHSADASIWGGSISLLAHGQIAVGVVVLVCSIVIPLLKLAGLFALTAPIPAFSRTAKSEIYKWIEIAGKWGMIDVLLVAVLVAAVKLGDLVSVHPGPGVLAFATTVLLSLLASATYNPHAIWETVDE